MFSIFTTNQALLEALHGSSFMHVIDFDIGLGIQYASLMKEIAEKAESCKINSPVLRISAVVPEEYAVESRLIRENLNQFAHELRIRVQVEFELMRTFETLSFKAVKFIDGEKKNRCSFVSNDLPPPWHDQQHHGVSRGCSKGFAKRGCFRGW